jgi:hypothetical protein
VPSFKVDFRKNLWYDFGSGEGGTMVDLFMKLERCTFHEAMIKLENRETPFVSLPQKPLPQSEKTLLMDVLTLNSPALLRYLSDRRIDTDTARCQCLEVHYSIAGRNYYAIGFRNDANGYELRNRHFKGSVSPKDITTFDVSTDDCIVFEGFMDYLSYLTMQNSLHPQTDTVVLNSAVYIDRAMDFLKRHKTVHTCLDNDSAGKNVLSKIRSQCASVVDLSEYYRNYKDLNEYLCDSSIDMDNCMFFNRNKENMKNQKPQKPLKSSKSLNSLKPLNSSTSPLPPINLPAKIISVPFRLQGLEPFGFWKKSPLLALLRVLFFPKTVHAGNIH